LVFGKLVFFSGGASVKAIEDFHGSSSRLGVSGLGVRLALRFLGAAECGLGELARSLQLAKLGQVPRPGATHPGGVEAMTVAVVASVHL